MDCRFRAVVEQARKSDVLYFAALLSKDRGNNRDTALGRRYLEILEAASAEVSQRRIDADAEFEATKATTAEHLEAVGHGLSTQPSARVNHVLAAERQFDHKINTAEPVRLAKAAADTAAKTVVSHSRRIVAAKAFIADAHTKLASFVQNSMKG